MRKVTKSILVPFLVFSALLLVISAAHAAPFSFNDNTIYWDTWISGNGDGLGYGNDNTTEYVGHPNFTGGSGEIVNGKLTQLHINYTNWDSALVSGDLFLDIGADKTWEYALTPAGRILSTNLDALKDSYRDNWYRITTRWNGYWIRNDHPYALNTSTASFSDIGSYTFSGFGNRDGSIDFTGLSIDLQGKDFIIGYAVTCANDVIYEKVPNHPVPEPATMLLLGSGLVGLAGFGRRKLLSK